MASRTPTPAAHLAALRLLELATPLARRLGERLGALDPPLSYRQYRVLVRVTEGATTVTEIARLAGVSLATVSVSVDPLVQRGLLTRATASHDRRCTSLTLTPEGRHAFDAASDVLDGFAHELAEALTAAVDPAAIGAATAVADAALALARTPGEQAAKVEAG